MSSENYQLSKKVVVEGRKVVYFLCVSCELPPTPPLPGDPLPALVPTPVSPPVPAPVSPSVPVPLRPKRVCKPRKIYDPSSPSIPLPAASDHTPIPVAPASMPAPLLPFSLLSISNSRSPSPPLHNYLPILFPSPQPILSADIYPLSPPQPILSSTFRPLSPPEHFVSSLACLSPPHPLYESDGEHGIPAGLDPPETTLHKSVYQPSTTPTWTIHLEGTNKNKLKLSDSIGFVYSVKKTSKTSVGWRCTSRPALNPCGAKVLQRITSAEFNTIYAQDDFKAGGSEHSHPAKNDLHEQLVVVLAAKKTAKDSRFLAPREIIMKELASRPGLRGAEMPSIEPLTRRLQYQRAKHLPLNPRQDDPLFPVHVPYFPSDWYRGAVTANGARHLIFSTDIGLRQLGDCPRWYVDGTFKLVTKPFMQLWRIKGFLKNAAKVIKQVPFVFVLMTRRRSCDYSAVFDFLLQQVRLPKVQEVMSDFKCVYNKC